MRWRLNARCDHRTVTNGMLANGEFGNELDQFTMVVISVDNDQTENERWLKPHNKLSTFKNPVTQQKVKSLSVAVCMPPKHIECLSFEELVSFFSEEFIKRLEIKPNRLPKGLDYLRLTKAIKLVLCTLTKQP
ncbi:MAG: hypothetical protein H7A01_19000 [Hahellaceae bacterium]|nr:hypothetical protein [Hahellaceae bacterium]